jgi:pimeloyl-ACP methyl ester carboxylesterase
MMTLRRTATVVLTLSCLTAGGVAAQGTGPTTQVDVGGHKLNVRVAGTARPGVPVVVFESGLGSPLATWSSVQTGVADSTRTIAYDRAGIGGSEAGTAAPTVKHIATELHTLLGKLEAPPPYVLVGHSWGGPIIQAFAAMFPREVAGLVYVDPTDWTQTKADMAAVGEQAGVKDAAEFFAKSMETQVAAAPAGIRAEASEVARLQRTGFAELREAGPAPDVPMVVLLAGKRQPLPPNVNFPGDYDRFFQATLRQRLDHFGGMAQRASNGLLLLSSTSGHFLQLSEPTLVTMGIRRVLSAATPRAELQRFVGEYPLAPTFVITITRDGDKLMLQATGQPALPLTAESATTFSIGMVSAKIEFETDAAGNVTALTLVQNGARQRAPKAK